MTGPWPLVPLGEVAGKPQYGWTSAARATAAGPPLLRTTDITRGAIDWASVPRCVTSPPQEERFLLNDGDILVSRAGSVGVSAMLSGPPPAVFASYLMRLRPGPRLLPRFLALFLKSPEYWSQISEVTNGIAMPNINASKLAAVRMPLPPLDEQQRLVDLLEDHLSRLDVARSLLESTTRRATALKRSALDAHTSTEGELVPLARLVARVEAGRSFGGATRPADHDEWGIVKVSSMTWGEFQPSENKAVADILRVDSRYEIKAGDVLVSRANTTAYVGAAVLVGETRHKLLLSDKSLRLVPAEGVAPAYLHAVLQAPRTRAQVSALATGTKDSMRNISQDSLLSVRVPLVGRDEQMAVLERVSETDRAVAQLRVELETAGRRAARLRRSLLAATFAGLLTSGVAGGGNV